MQNPQDDLPHPEITDFRCGVCGNLDIGHGSRVKKQTQNAHMFDRQRAAEDSKRVKNGEAKMTRSELKSFATEFNTKHGLTFFTRVRPVLYRKGSVWEEEWSEDDEI